MTPELAILDVRLHGRTIGTLTRLPGDRILFAFDDAYVADPDRPVLSLSFRDELGALITDMSTTQTRLPPFFANLLPEGALRDYLAARAGVNRTRDFFLLGVLGRDLPGALEILLVDVPPWPEATRKDADPTSERDQDLDALHFSLAGVQLKFSAVQEATGGLTIPAEGVGGSWIVKLPSTTFSGVPENEFAMMTLASRVGIDVPEISLVPIASIRNLPTGINVAGESAFVIRRFDRQVNGVNVHIEDFAQVFGVYPDRKYERASYRNIAEVLWNESGEAAITEFLRRLVFNALIGNGDMHLKNWSLIYPDTRTPQLAPAYDFVATIAYLPDDRLALGFGGSRAFDALTLDAFERFAAKARLPATLTLRTVRDTVGRFREVWRDTGDPSIPDMVRAAIERHLARMPLWAGFGSTRQRKGSRK